MQLVRRHDCRHLSSQSMCRTSACYISQPLFRQITPPLRKQPHIEALGTHLPYVRKSPTLMATADLPIGTQATFIASAAADLQKPLNVLLTIRWRSLFSDNDVNASRVKSPAEAHGVPAGRLPSGFRVRHPREAEP